ncbi:hypothetical protein [Pedobacter metabolipauper]|uniref:DUF2116 family Zn-ribbon domain-containing protein n=1 Tax=Pedobacter metabolipauper TaxID=425513 RepID=A0A4V3D1C7_9SPHI|nr:hypothetical protein [Pedobacter metabolipauper]TDQ10147.1 hypothetical protein ATK78_2312 [Pedobacter metabolipauper]
MNAEKHCLNCRDIIKGRADKKFCDDSCRSNYNYFRNGAEEITLVRYINSALKKNRGILKSFDIEADTKVEKGSLLAKGFDFGYFTSIFENEKLNRCYFCYEMGYLVINEYEILLIKN